MRYVLRERLEKQRQTGLFVNYYRHLGGDIRELNETSLFKNGTFKFTDLDALNMKKMHDKLRLNWRQDDETRTILDWMTKFRV